jgi:hypothetical protein
MPPAARVTAEDIHALVDGLSDLSLDVRRLGDKTGDNTAEMKLVRAEMATLTLAFGRVERLLEKQQDSGHLHRVLMVFEKAPWQSASALLAVVALILALTIGHVDLVALVAAYSHPKVSP